MTSERHLYKHVETGIETMITDRVAAVFGDKLVRVEEEPESPKPTRSRKKAEENDDSSKEGNE
jgi:hypothetical protein